MHLSNPISLIATAFLASANPQGFPPLSLPIAPAGPVVGSIVSTALASVPIPSAVAPVVASAVAAVPAAPNNANADSIPGLGIPPDQLYDSILAAFAILNVVLTLLNLSKFADSDNQNVKNSDLDLPIPGLSDLLSGGSLGYTITTLVDSIIPLLNTISD